MHMWVITSRTDGAPQLVDALRRVQFDSFSYLPYNFSSVGIGAAASGCRRYRSCQGTGQKRHPLLIQRERGKK
jgi:hypothetical protein